MKNLSYKPEVVRWTVGDAIVIRREDNALVAIIPYWDKSKASQKAAEGIAVQICESFEEKDIEEDHQEITDGGRDDENLKKELQEMELDIQRLAVEIQQDFHILTGICSFTHAERRGVEAFFGKKIYERLVEIYTKEYIPF